jgi:hypothetical protein
VGRRAPRTRFHSPSGRGPTSYRTWPDCLGRPIRESRRCRIHRA